MRVPFPGTVASDMPGYLEILSNTLTTVSIFLAARNNIHTWWTGILGSVCFGMLFYASQLYADALLQVFFIASSLLGWHQWLGGHEKKLLPVTRATSRLMVCLVVAGLAVALAYGFLLHQFTDAYAPFVDSAVLVFSVAAQLLMVKRKLQCWQLWLLVNTLSVPLFWSRGLHLTAVLYLFYWVNAVFGYRHWHAQYQRQPAGVAS